MPRRSGGLLMQDAEQIASAIVEVEVVRAVRRAAPELTALAQNVVQVMEAGVTAGYFNALEKNFPITIATDRVASPIGHKLLIRPDSAIAARRTPRRAPRASSFAQ